MLSPPLFSSSQGLLCCLVGTLLLTGCVSMGPSSQNSNVQGASQVDLTASDVETRLQKAAERWSDTPHQLGGSSLQGVDCSGLVQSIFSEEFAVDLPRTTAEQARSGHVIDRSALRTGDLVFFRPSNRDRHVGIYLSNGRFLHASSSNGVTTSSLDAEYWSNRWWHARRVFTLSSDSSSGANSGTVSQRNGW